MPWKEVSIMSAREEFVRLVLQPGANKSELCRRFEISRPTGDKWIERFQMQGKAGLAQRSRRPQRTPARTTADIEETIVAQRKEHPAWGTRTLKAQGAPASARTQGFARSGEYNSRDPWHGCTGSAKETLSGSTFGREDTLF